MKRRVDETDGGRSAAKRLENALEVFSLKNEEFIESGLSLVIVRLIGKPVGIFLGILIGKAALRLKLPFSLADALLIGALGTLGLDVSLIFAQRDFMGIAQNLAILGILVTIPVGIALALIIHFLSPRDGRRINL